MLRHLAPDGRPQTRTVICRRLPVRCRSAAHRQRPDDVERQDRRGRAGQLADRAGDVVRRPVVEQATDDGRVGTARQQHRDLVARSGRRAQRELDRRPGEPAVRAVDQLELDVQPRLRVPGRAQAAPRGPSRSRSARPAARPAAGSARSGSPAAQRDPPCRRAAARSSASGTAAGPMTARWPARRPRAGRSHRSRSSTTTRIGKSTRTTQAPSVNLVTAKITTTIAEIAPDVVLITTLDRQCGAAVGAEVLRHAEAGQGEAGEDADRIERDQVVDVTAGRQDQRDRRRGQHHDAVREGQPVAALGQPARQIAVRGNEVGEEREAVERRVRAGVEDQHRRQLDRQEREMTDEAVTRARPGPPAR